MNEAIPKLKNDLINAKLDPTNLDEARITAKQMDVKQLEAWKKRITEVIARGKARKNTYRDYLKKAKKGSSTKIGTKDRDLHQEGVDLDLPASEFSKIKDELLGIEGVVSGSLKALKSMKAVERKAPIKKRTTAKYRTIAGMTGTPAKEPVPEVEKKVKVELKTETTKPPPTTKAKRAPPAPPPAAPKKAEPEVGKKKDEKKVEEGKPKIDTPLPAYNPPVPAKENI